MTRLVDARTGISILDEAECLRRLGAEQVGRLGVIAGGAPMIFPVNYVLDGRDIVFRTDEGTKLDAGPRSRACFEIDGVDQVRRSGWSVVASGRLEEITHYDAKTLARAKELPIHPWARGDKAHWMRLIPARVTGRNVGDG